MIAAVARAIGFGREAAPVVTSAPASEGLARLLLLLLKAAVKIIAALLPPEVRAVRGVAETEARSVLTEAGEAGVPVDALLSRVGGLTHARQGVAIVALSGILRDLEAEGDRIRLSGSILAKIRGRAEREAAEAELTRAQKAMLANERAAAARAAAAAAEEAHSREQHLRTHPSGPCRWSRCWACSGWPPEGLPVAALAGHPLHRCEAGCLVCATWPALPEAA